MANITLGQLRDLWQAVADWANGLKEPKVQLSGSRVPQHGAVLTTTPLGASGVYVAGPFEAFSVQYGHITGVAYVGAVLYADVPGTLFLEQSSNQTNWHETGRFPVSGGEWQIIPLQPIVTQYYRWRYANGSTAQGSFHLAEFRSHIDGRVRPFKLQLHNNRTVMSGGALYTGQTTVLGIRSAAVWVSCTQPYRLIVYPGIGLSQAGAVVIADQQSATQPGQVRYHQVPPEALPAQNFDFVITNLGSSDATVSMWFVGVP